MIQPAKTILAGSVVGEENEPESATETENSGRVFDDARTSFSLREYLEEFLKFEEENDFFSLKIKGHRVWDYIRGVLWFQPVSAFWGHTPHSTRTKRHWFGEALKSVAYLFSWLLRKKKQYDIVIVNYDRNRPYDGKDVNITTYPVVKRLASKYSILLLDPASFDVEVEKNYPCDVLRFRPFYLIDVLLSRFFTFYSSRDKKVFEMFEKKLRLKWGAVINIDKKVKQFCAFQARSYETYLKIFTLYRPKVVLYAESGHVKGLIQAAHELGVPAVELQHGIASRTAIFWNYPPSIVDQGLPTLSDYVVTFGKYWHPYYRLPACLMDAGFPYLEGQGKFSNGQNPGHGADSGKNIIIITDCLFSKQCYIQTALALSALLPDYVIYYKLRPDDYKNWRSRYPSALADRPNIKVIDNDDIAFHSYLEICSYQIGINSTGLFEGLAYGLVTFILKTGRYEDMSGLYEPGYVFLVSEVEEITDKIRGGGRPPGRLDMGAVFKANSLHNIEEAIKGILESHASCRRATGVLLTD